MPDRYPPIADYALLSDCSSTALVSRDASIDWCCMPSMDADACYGRLLDWEKGGYCRLSPQLPEFEIARHYLGDSMVLETRFRAGTAQANVIDFFAMEAGELSPSRLIRLLEGVHGEIPFSLDVMPRLDYGNLVPHVRQHDQGVFVAIGGDNGLAFRTDMPVNVVNRHGLQAAFMVHEGERFFFIMEFHPPETIDEAVVSRTPASAEYYASVQQTVCAWSGWAKGLAFMEGGTLDPQSRRSALVLKALTSARTGAIAAAPTTSLPECSGKVRNWDYRYSWVRDSVFTVRALYRLGCPSEAEAFMRFIQRSSAGSAAQLQIMYGLDGKRRLTEVELCWLEGYRGSRPVRIGNKASEQCQLDLFGEIMELAWVWHASGHAIDSAYWEFLRDVVDTACSRGKEPDSGIWEFRGAPQHFVHSKAMCWCAIDFGIRLCKACGFDASLSKWKTVRAEIRQAIEKQGYDRSRGVFIQAFDQPAMDAALLLLPRIDFVAYDDPRMLRTVDLIRAELDQDGLLRRYVQPDGLPGPEGTFLPCTFWLAACLAEQKRFDLAREYYGHALACANELGLLPEEYDSQKRQMLGNYPQGLTHVSQIMACLAMISS